MSILSNRSALIPMTVDPQGLLYHDVLSSMYARLPKQISTSIQHTVTADEVCCPDLIAYRVYRDEALWWIVCTFGGIVDPAYDMYIGQVLNLPRLAGVEAALVSYNSQVRDSNTQSFVTI